jgi:hypothetical protein
MFGVPIQTARRRRRFVIGTRKKKQKKLLEFRPRWFQRLWPKTNKSFLLLFFKKEVLAFLLSVLPFDAPRQPGIMRP